jgi:LysM repeat protein
MNEPSPLVPQGSFEAHARSKSRVKLAFYTIVAIHVLAIAGFLIIGCKRDDKDAASNAPATNDLATIPPMGTDPSVVTPAVTNTNPPVAIVSNAAPTNPTGISSIPTTPATPTSPPVVPDVAAPATTEHTIVKGDSFSTLSTKYGVSVKAIQLANPNLNPTKLKIGDKVKIPAKTTTMASTGNGLSPASTSDSGVYTVKSGDTLSKIAATHKTTIKELQKLNGMTTTQIRVGQKLKVPQTGAAPGAAASGGTAVPAGTTPPPAQ